MPNTITEGRHAGEFIIDDEVAYSREQIIVLSGQVLEAGHVVGMIALGAATPAAVTGNTGNGTLASATVGLGAKVGVYRATCIEPAANLGKFTVEDPDGVNVGVATVATEFTGGGLTFTIADGSTDFASGDAFTITVAAGSGKVKEYNPANTDGSAVPAGILYDAVDATAADKRGVILARHAVVNAAELVWFSGASANQKATGLAGLALLGIIGR
jgi:hypothetical protein